ncbi:hypothetical protein ACG33_01360 [Steroidobacter denitrificans]|uniref:Uncharacterized protein n=1 Tax=Steroidobacter denitrificans TaxID=465721 RepID=A0A127F5Q4_STEDE|nr:hypothetical protein [Steroidobacter denitrificans]AMN45774.1 hypothetical protein ACG33_01360 [Steroidobacter denitrificans]
MEILLLWADNLDDAIGALRHYGPRIMELLVALVLFVATGIGLLLAPSPVLAVVGCAVVTEVVRRRRLRAWAAHRPISPYEDGCR